MVADRSEPHSRFTIHNSRTRARRTCVLLAIAAAGWSLLAAVTGGIAIPFFSSRNPRNPALAAVLMIATAWALADPDSRIQQLRDDLRWFTGHVRLAGLRAWTAWTRVTGWVDAHVPPVTAPLIAIVVGVGIVVTAIRNAAFIAAGSDAWGYVSQAHMWASGTLRTPEPLMAALKGFLPLDAMAPLAYRPGLDGASIVPVTSPGLPMLMALFELVGGRRAVFDVVPMLAALTVWFTYLLGRQLTDRWTGAIAAVLLATSPAFLFQLTSSPMSDIPAAAFWTLSLVFALRGRGSWSGLAAAGAVLIRANLAPVAVVPAAILLIRPATGSYSPREGGRYEAIWFMAGVVPAALFIAALYGYWYGSPLNSGYGALGQLYSLANGLPNLTRYSRWLFESQSPLVLAALAAPPLVTNRRAAIGLAALVVAVFACYIFYIPFDAWWFLRFLLPGFPALVVLTAAGLVALARWLPGPFRVIVVVAVVALVARHTVGYASARATFDTGGEQKYAITGRYVAEHLPQNAVILAELHSGGIRYYSGRTTIRFGSIPADHLENALAELQRLGYRPYLVAEDWEEEAFRRQFAGRGVLSQLTDGPETELPLGHVRFYPLAR